ncbi:nuclear transport factor 2 [Panus rudis PR-1116 ss-1]|nr:nuclear transport factor 2 [Panus rudis PR-1116 ss-1]
MGDPLSIATQFVTFYYTTFDTDRNGLAGLYRDHSMLTWEGAQLQGVQAIGGKLTSLPFEKVEHKIVNLDAQPSSTTVASLICSVTGFLKIDGGEHELPFTQVFQLMPEGGSYYVFNDIFRLNLG